MEVVRGLVIREPWIDHILRGEKTWEMRSAATNIRGIFGLIRKGSGKVWGIARLTGCERQQTNDEMQATFRYHRIPPAEIDSVGNSKWRTPWLLADIQTLAVPVPYKHRLGATLWVGFDPDVTEAIAEALP